MQNLYEMTGDDDFLPNVYVFSSLIEAFSKSSESDKSSKTDVQKALEILHLMENHQNPEVKPNTVTYSTVINALARSEGGFFAAETAERILNRMIDLSRDGF